MEKRLLKTLDRPRLFMFLEGDEMMLGIALFSLIFLVGKTLLWLNVGFAISFVAVYMYKKKKKRGNMSLLQSYSYWNVPRMSNSKMAMPPRHVREMLL